ncbi:hypothetical protein Y032_0030g2050 [Ancylostoma ceylanicum]|uniref:Uncharacterized protein n=1 Tax=Ancylostoma ceylanicum TaxID=53326 RepID=A0A016USI3_9BILA|nr:hypothetical protein Y032_0030g2050 [Ancylostoma ceylanicum]
MKCQFIAESRRYFAVPVASLRFHEAGHRLAKSEILKRSHVAEEALPLIDPNEVAFLHTAKLQKMATVGQAAGASASAITTPNSLCSTPVSLYPQHQLYQYITANPFANQLFCFLKLTLPSLPRLNKAAREVFNRCAE